MKKGVLIVLLFVLLTIAVLGIIGLNLTGYVSLDSDFHGIFRAIPVKNTTTNTTDVYLRIASTENVIAIQEFFSSPECNVLDYSLNKEIELFEFNDNENTWIFANNSNTLDIELFYQIPFDCNIISGKYYTIGSFTGNNWCNGADTNKDTVVDASDYITLKENFGNNCSEVDCHNADINGNGIVDWADMIIFQTEAGNTDCSETPESSINSYDYQPSNTTTSNESNLNYSTSSIINPGSSGSSSSSGGSSSSRAAITQVKTNEITQVNSNEEYIAQSLSATENLASIQEDLQNSDPYSSYLMIILAVIAVAIVGFIIFSITKKPKSFEQNIRKSYFF